MIQHDERTEKEKTLRELLDQVIALAKDLSTTAPKYVTAPQAAEMLGLNVRSVTHLCRQGKLPAYKMGETRAGWRINREELEKIFEAGRIDLPPKPKADQIQGGPNSPSTDF